MDPSVFLILSVKHSSQYNISIDAGEADILERFLPFGAHHVLYIAWFHTDGYIFDTGLDQACFGYAVHTDVAGIGKSQFHIAAKAVTLHHVI